MLSRRSRLSFRSGGAAWLGLGVVLASCGGSAPPPTPGQTRGIAPDLRGSRVVLLPVQQVSGIPGDVDAEVRFALTDRGQGVVWVHSEEVERVLARSPSTPTRTTQLPVGVFLQAEVERVGDPLFGMLRRLAGLVDAEAVLLPVAATFEPDLSVPGSGPRVRLQAALIEPRTGRVLWYGMEQGEVLPAAQPRALASASEELARSLLWYITD